MSAVTKISPGYKIDIPEELRNREAGSPDNVVFFPQGDHVVLLPFTDFDRLRGIARGANPDIDRDRDDRY